MSYSSPKNNSRACLCKDKRTYSRQCCDGSLWAQGIGRIQAIPPSFEFGLLMEPTDNAITLPEPIRYLTDGSTSYWIEGRHIVLDNQGGNNYFAGNSGEQTFRLTDSEIRFRLFTTSISFPISSFPATKLTTPTDLLSWRFEYDSGTATLTLNGESVTVEGVTPLTSPSVLYLGARVETANTLNGIFISFRDSLGNAFNYDNLYGNADLTPYEVVKSSDNWESYVNA